MPGISPGLQSAHVGNAWLSPSALLSQLHIMTRESLPSILSNEPISPADRRRDAVPEWTCSKTIIRPIESYLILNQSYGSLISAQQRLKNRDPLVTAVATGNEFLVHAVVAVDYSFTFAVFIMSADCVVRSEWIYQSKVQAYWNHKWFIGYPGNVQAKVTRQLVDGGRQQESKGPCQSVSHSHSQPAVQHSGQCSGGWRDRKGIIINYVWLGIRSDKTLLQQYLTKQGDRLIQ